MISNAWMKLEIGERGSLLGSNQVMGQYFFFAV
jgi:hypothetical protein